MAKRYIQIWMQYFAIFCKYKNDYSPENTGIILLQTEEKTSAGKSFSYTAEVFLLCGFS